MTSQLFFDSVYNKANKLKDKYIWGSKPDKLILQSMPLIKGNQVLDLGVGEGKDAVYLAKKNFSVLGVDCSKVGLLRLKNNMKKLNVQIKVKKCLIEEFTYTKKYDAIFAINTLQFVERKNMKKVVQSMKLNTSSRGLNVIKVVTTNDPQYKHQKDRTFFKPNELKNLYKDWKVIHYKEYISELEKHTKDNEWHRHANAEIIAIKK